MLENQLALAKYKRNRALQNHLKFIRERNEIAPLKWPFGEDSFSVVPLETVINRGPFITHVGKMLIVRLIAKAFERKAVNDEDLIQSLAEDPTGKLAIVLLVTMAVAKSSGEALKVGSVFTVKSPCLLPLNNDYNINNEYNNENNGNMALFIDRIANFELIQPENKLLREITWQPMTPESKDPVESDRWKDLGNEQFSRKEFKRAIQCYDKAIEQDEFNALVYSNRSAAYAQLGKYKEALKDAEKALELDDSVARFYFRKAWALHRLHQYESSLSFLKTNSAKHVCKDVNDVKQLKAKAKEAIVESRHGQYDLLKMIEEVKTSPYLDHAEYFDETMLQVRPVDGHFHGVVALKRIEAGTLVIASKALTFWPPSQEEFDEYSYDFFTPAWQACEDDKELEKELLQLYSGSWGPVDKEEANSASKFEMKKVIVRLHKFPNGTPKGTSYGFFLKPAFLNFSCVDNNCDRYNIGDFMFVRAVRRIEPGEQLFLLLHPVTFSFEERDRFYREHRSYICNCRLCLMESAESSYVRKQILTRQIMINSVDSGKMSLEKAISLLEEVVKDLDEIRKDSPMNPMGCRARSLLAAQKIKSGCISEAIKINLSIIEPTQKMKGWNQVLQELYFNLAIENHSLSLSIASSKTLAREAKKWKGKLKAMANIFYGDATMLQHLGPAYMLLGFQHMGFY